ncbi:MAG: (Fe-S)-binding protein [Candidatus Helarchaeota archaeon]
MVKDLVEFHEMVWHCTKCANCWFINPYFVQNAEFYYNCPSGVKFGFDSHHSGGRMEIARGLIEEELVPTKTLSDIVYSCTLCGNCHVQCNFLIELEPLNVFEALRRKLVKDGFGQPAHQAFKESIEQNHNPYKEAHEKRTRWSKKKDLKEQAEVLYFVGCTSSYRTKEIAENTVKLLDKLGVDYTISSEEYCCGSPLLRTGYYEAGIACMNHNMDLVRKVGAKKVIFSCAGCFRTFKDDYKEELGDLGVELQHVSEFLASEIKDGKLKLNRKEAIVTYHDPCHLGRHCDVYDEPRDVITSVPGTRLIEMDRNKFNAWCCGSGGGVKSAFKEMALDTAKERLREALSTGASVLLSCCPFCKLNMEDANKKSLEKVEIKDVTEYIVECLEENE